MILAFVVLINDELSVNTTQEQNQKHQPYETETIRQIDRHRPRSLYVLCDDV